MYNVHVCLPKADRFQKFKLQAAPGEILLEVLLRNNIAIHHDCGGVCHCTTCHLFITRGLEFIEKPSRRERDFLKKVAGLESTSRLACQCLLLEGKGEIDVQLPKTAAYLQE